MDRGSCRQYAGCTRVPRASPGGRGSGRLRPLPPRLRPLEAGAQARPWSCLLAATHLAPAVVRDRHPLILKVDAVQPRYVAPEDLRLDLWRQVRVAVALDKLLRHLEVPEVADYRVGV